jgi:sugar (pentulose or hexulose) kinase
MTQATHVLAIDQGTTSTRAIVFDRSARAVATAQAEFAQHYPEPGWVEHDPEDIWRDCLATARGALAKAGVGAAQIAAIGVTNQRETVVVWDRATGAPIHRAIVWQDRRTAETCLALRQDGMGDWFPRAPAWSSIPISRAPSWPGFSTMCPAPARGQSGRAGLRHDRLLPAVALDRRPGPRHRRDQRRAHHAL